MSKPSPKTVIIVGGSLGGLFAGVVLVRLGYNVTILERTPTVVLKDQGAGISVAPVIPPILKALRKIIPSGCSIMDFIAEYDRTGVISRDVRAEGLQYLRSDGSVKSTIMFPQTGLTGTTSWDLLYNILRANFDGGFENGYVASVPKEESDGYATYLSGMCVTGIQDLGGNEVKVYYDGPDETQMDLVANFVIGADGPSSTVRNIFLPENKRAYAGYVAWRGTVKENLLSSAILTMLGEKCSFFHRKGEQVVMYRRSHSILRFNVLSNA
jgi:2-polyprenyl-6-methoxyphenol hydroxylase-like FAD-dependent oxidoreductase